MSGFDPGWLDLREPADREARDGRLLQIAAEWANGHAGPIVDLGCGTGSTARAMTGLLAPDKTWRLVDNDPVLLQHATDRIGPAATAVRADLSDVSELPLGGAGLVTGSALFDLVSAEWIDAFATALAAGGTALYAALTYDGRTTWSPGHPADAAVLDTFNRHQRKDKGLGPALGPDATDRLAGALRERGYEVETAPSDWRLGASAAALAREHAKGVAVAAAEAGIEETAAKDWLAYRSEQAAQGMTVVGHLDLFARPPTRP